MPIRRVKKRVRKSRLRRYWSVFKQYVKSSWSAEADRPWLRRVWSTGVRIALTPIRLARLVLRRIRRLLVKGWRQPAVRNFMYGTPALAAAGGLVALTAIPKGDLAAEYQIRAAQAVQQKDYATAKTCLQRLVQFDPDRDENLYALAVTLEALGEKHRASVLMERLAPSDAAGYPRARLWLARRLLGGEPVTPTAVRAAEVHLRRALQVSRDNDDAHALLGQICLADGRLDEAEQHLRQAMIKQPRHVLSLARIEFARGNRERGLNHARQAVNYLQRLAESDPGDQGARLLWAESLLVAEEYRAAVDALLAGLRLTDSANYRSALAKAYAIWFDALARGRLADDGERLGLLEAGLRFDPANRALIERLVVLSRARGKEAEKARSALEALLAQGRAPASVHLLLAVDAWGRGQVQEAGLHFQRAYDLAPHLPEVANNMAWFLARDDKPDLDRALVLVNSALEKSPDHPEFRDTRGQILVKLGRWGEALKDLEFALPAKRDDPSLHLALAEVYDQLRMPALAKEHRKLANSRRP